MTTNAQKISRISGEIKIRAKISHEDLRDLLWEVYRLRVVIDGEDEAEKEKPLKELESYLDSNYLVTGFLDREDNGSDEEKPSPQQFVLKIYNSAEMNNRELMKHLNTTFLTKCYQDCSNYFETPYPIPPLSTEGIYKIAIKEDAIFKNCSKDGLIRSGELTSENGKVKAEHLTRLTRFIPGQIIRSKKMNDQLLFHWGESIARILLSLESIPAPTFPTRTTFCNMLHAANILPDPFLKHLDDVELVKRFEEVLGQLQKKTLPLLQETHILKQWIHGDHGLQNTLQKMKGDNKISAIIDFDDTTFSYRMVDLGTAITDLTGAYPTDDCAMLNAIHQLVLGYTSIITINQVEREVLYNLALTSFVINVSVSNYQCKFESDDPYTRYFVDVYTEAFNRFYELGEERFLAAL